MAGEPSAPTERIESLDVLRGFAVLGILVMNISSYSMPAAAYFNPTAWGSLDGLDGWVWRVAHLLADSKFLAIFSMLFGAGIVLMWQRAEARSQGSAGIHYRRMFWLIVIGLLHAHLLWYQDVLYFYGMAGLLVYLFRKSSPAMLIGLGVIFLSVGPAYLYTSTVSYPQWSQAAQTEYVEYLDPPEAAKQLEISQYRGTWLEQMVPRRARAIEMQTHTFLYWALWRTGGLMLLGMALYKLGVLSAARSRRFYAALIAVAVFVGLPLIGYGMQYNFSIDWRAPRFFLFGLQFNYWASTLVALGWIGVVMLFCKSRVAWVTRPLAAVGRMAFSNYILQTLICTTLFYGHGFGLFAAVDRTGQMLIVWAIWAFQIIVSSVWIQRFHYGPLEWLWRSLAYLEVQPFRRHPKPDTH